MTVEAYITHQLTETFQPTFLQVLNESHGHSVPKGSETHFKVVIVSDAFASRNAVQRHRSVYAALADALAGGVHALAIHTYTPAEWQLAASVPDSPVCMGGNKR